MKTARDLLYLIVVFLIGALCLNGYFHNLYLMAASDVSLMTILRAIGAILFPLGIVLGLI